MKVFLRALSGDTESPWAKVLTIDSNAADTRDPALITAQIENYPAFEMSHGFSNGDIVAFKRTRLDSGWIYEPTNEETAKRTGKARN